MSRIDPDRLADLLARARREVDAGALPSCQLSLALDGEPVVSEAFGDATRESRYVLFSVTKALTAGIVWLLVGDGTLSYDARVADLVPGFGSNGKAAVTVEHLLLHTAGFPHAPMPPLEGAERRRRVERFGTWRCDWEPGTRTEYHATSAHWVIAEVVDRSAGDYRRVFAERITGPLGLGLRLGPAQGEDAGVREIRIVGGAAVSAGDLELPEIRNDTLLRFNEPEVRDAGVPGAGGVGTAADVALYLQALLRNPDERWRPDVLADGTGTIRNALPDPYTRAPANRTRGLVVAGDDGMAAVRGFGRTAGPRAFASPGVGGQVAWADPATGLSFCFLTDGIDADLVAAFRRGIALSNRAEACVAR